jgi:filamentous hemagglutinin
MNLPNAHAAVVEPRKVSDYLLNEAHPDNGGKARFFEALGFGRHNVETLLDALRKLAVSASVTQVVRTVHGEKYVLDGPLQGPAGVTARLRTIWIIDLGASTPRLVTAYPQG